MYALSFTRRPDGYTLQGQRILVGILPNLSEESLTDRIVNLAHKRQLQQSVPRALRALSTNRSKSLYAAKGWSPCVLCPGDHREIFVGFVNKGFPSCKVGTPYTVGVDN